MTRRIPGEGSVFQTNNNGKPSYCASISYQDENDKRRFVRGYGTTPQQALQRRRANLNRLLSKNPEERRRSGRTVKSLFDEWTEFNQGRIAASTAEKYRESIEGHILPFVGDEPLALLDGARLNKLFTDDLATVGPSARAHAYKVFSTLSNWAVRNAYVDRSPLRLIKAPKNTIAVRESDQARASYRNNIAAYLINWLDDPENPHYDDYPRVLFMFIGLRRGELLGLTWNCVNNLNTKGKATLVIRQQMDRHRKGEGLTGWYIRNTTKTGKTRSIPLPERWRKALLVEKRKNREAKEEWASDLVFLKPNGKHYDFNDHYDLWNEILTAYVNNKRESGLPLTEDEYFRPHAARHVAATLMFKENVPLEVAQQILGHSSIAQSLYYTHITGEQKKSAMEALGSAMEKGGPKKEPKN